MNPTVTSQQWMIIAASRHISDGEVVNVGMRGPLLAFALAKLTHAPAALGFFDVGLVRDAPLSAALVTMCDSANIRGSVWCADMMDLMNLMQQGHVDVGVLGGAEVDQFGNLNTSYIGDPQKPQVQLPGSGGACDIAQLSRRTILMMPHVKKRLVRHVQFITSLGYGHDGLERDRLHLPGGPSALVTTLAVFQFNNLSHRAELAAVRPGVEVAHVRESTGWDIIGGNWAAPPVLVPTHEEVLALRHLDEQGFWTGGEQT